MINLTLLSLSISSFYSLSPMITGSGIHIQHSSFKRLFPTLIYNPEKLLLEKSTFSFGTNAIIYIFHPQINLRENEILYENKNYPLTDGTIYINNEKFDGLLIIHDCHFNQIIVPDNKPMITISGYPTFYMTNCVFISCASHNGLLDISTRATKITHICCSNLTHTGTVNNKYLFMYAKPPRDSFFQFVYSTIFGIYENSNSDYILRQQGPAATKLQCLNFSSFKSKYIMHFTSPECLNLIMNTFDTFTSYEHTFFFNFQDGDAGSRYKHYVAFCNFKNIKYSNQYNLICLDMNDNTKFSVDSCFFFDCRRLDWDDQTYYNFISFNGEKKQILVENCVFDIQFSFASGINNPYLEVKNTKVDSNAEIPTLAHFVTENACLGEEIEAFGCQNHSCPDLRGCKPEAFEFNESKGDIIYTEIFHEGFDTPTPTPTNDFTFSLLFSFSVPFSYSRVFSESCDFSSSFYFSKSKGFTETDEFSKTASFSKSDDFTRSTYFSKSSDFSSSFYFSKTKYFSSSFYFSKTKEFTETEDFTKTSLFSESNNFTNSCYFSKSSDFSSSFYFSKTKDFTETNKFSKTTVFSKSDDFTRSIYFSKSNDFNKSLCFSESNDFSSSFYFSKTTEFTETNDFSKTTSFSNSDDFTRSLHFSESSDFNASFYFSNSAKFTNSLKFSDSIHFSETSQFSVSSIFTKTNDFSASDNLNRSHPFTKSSTFTRSNDFSFSYFFSNSNEFSSSFYFSKTEEFTETSEFSKTTSFSKSDDFTKSFYFSKSSDFTRSLYFAKTQNFSKSNDFSSSIYFTKSSLFSKSTVFSSSLYFSKSIDFTKSIPLINAIESTIYFSNSEDFTKSYVFSNSEIFSFSKTLIQKSLVQINIKTENNSNSNTGMKIGIGITCGALVAVFALVGLFLLRRRKLGMIEDLNEETIEITEDTANSFVHTNPLNQLMSEDDPFEDEFD